MPSFLFLACSFLPAFRALLFAGVFVFTSTMQALYAVCGDEGFK